MVIEVVGIVLVESGADDDGLWAVELFIAFAHEAGVCFVDEAAFDEVLDMRVEGCAGAGGELCDVCC